MVVVYIFISTAVIGGMAATSPAGVLDSSSVTVGIDINLSSLYTSKAFVHLYDSNIISRICHATSSVVPIIVRNAFIHRRNIHTSAEDQSLGMEDRGTAGKMPRTTRKNCRSQRTHRRALYTNVCDAEGTDIWPASVARHRGLRGNAQLVESTVICIASALRHAGPSPCSRMPAWSLRLATAVARRRRSGAPFPGNEGHVGKATAAGLHRSYGAVPAAPCAFRREVPTWGGGAVVDAAAAAVAPAAATVTGSGVFPAASGRRAEGASTAVAVATVTGSGVFPAASARGAAGALASAAVTAASVAATATAAAAIPPDGARETAAA